MASGRWIESQHWNSKLDWQNDSKLNQDAGQWNYSQWEPEPAGTGDQDRFDLIHEVKTLRKDAAILSSAVTEAQHAAAKSAAAAAQAEAWAAVAASKAVEDVKDLHTEVKECAAAIKNLKTELKDQKTP